MFGKKKNNTSCEIVGANGDWLETRCDNGSTGYCKEVYDGVGGSVTGFGVEVSKSRLVCYFDEDVNKAVNGKK